MHDRSLSSRMILALIGLLAGLVAALIPACRTETHYDYKSCRSCGECALQADPPVLQEEARRNMGAIYVAETSYLSSANTYGPTFQQINWYPLVEYRYAYFLPEETIQPEITEPYLLPAGLTPAVNEWGFTAYAVGNIDCDTVLDIWMVNDLKVIENLTDDVAE